MFSAVLRICKISSVVSKSFDCAGVGEDDGADVRGDDSADVREGDDAGVGLAISLCVR